MKSTIAVLMLFTAVLLGSVDADCPELSEFTTSSTCEYICGKPCGLQTQTFKNICLCIEGYLKDPDTGKCIPEKDCKVTIPDNTPTLRNAEEFKFSCFAS
ncbi:AGAP002636-PA-like protein [Anopheles sinensis]|uniref:AGAP002636-PA-like protein n=1 Tax=Anopheles sinensis TaxID=74873 RepID=A0A084WUT1_ANOSI|nr:AGAP002636-PA-like protein [Anopheles sinensis]